MAIKEVRASELPAAEALVATTEATQRQIDAVEAKHACVNYELGTKIMDVSFDDLLWFRDVLPRLAKAVEDRIGFPLWTIARGGYGYSVHAKSRDDGGGHAYGNADRSGSGDGSGARFGYGYSRPDGSGESP